MVRLRLLGFSAILVVLFKFAMTPIFGVQPQSFQLILAGLFFLVGVLAIIASYVVHREDDLPH